MFYSYDAIIAILLVGLCANDDEHLIPLLVVGPIFETAFVLFPGFTFSALLSILLILKATIRLFANRNPGQSTAILIMGVLYLALTFMYGGATTGLRGLEAASIPQIISAFSKILLLWAIYRITSTQNFAWHRFWHQQRVLGLGTLFLVYTHLITEATSYNWHNTVERLGYQGADLNEFSISCLALVPLILHRDKVHITGLFGLSSLALVVLILLKTVSLSATLVFIIFLLSFLTRDRQFMIIASVLFACSLFFLPQVSELLQKSSIGVRAEYLLEGRANSDFSTGRLTIWQGALSGIAEYPLLGVGPGANSEVSLNQQQSGIALVTHNTILQFLISFGLLGLTLLISLIIAYKNQLFNKSSVSILYSLFIIFLGAMSLSWLWKDLFWILLGLHLGLNRFHKPINL